MASTTRSRRSSTSAEPIQVDQFQAAMDGRLPGLFGIKLHHVEQGTCELRMELREEFMAPNDFLHAGAVVSLADTACGIGCRASLPEGGTGFTTIELKSNFLRSARAGDALSCRAALSHGGRTTQVWDATVVRESDGRELALFRCTQMVLRG
jgi:1,4-dihydroxy-2-naphthoyl-CoA hydrolase